MNQNSMFYNNVEAYTFVEHDQKELFYLLTEMARPLPSDWHLIVFQIDLNTKNNYGKNHIYSFIENACIAVILNKIKAKGIDVPFVSFGDCGYAAVPQDVYREVIEGILSFQKYCFSKFKLHLKISSIKIEVCNALFGDTLIVKTNLHNHVHNSHFIGVGIKNFKDHIKTNTEYDVSYVDFIYLENYSLDGLLCPLYTSVVPNHKDFAVNLVVKPSLDGVEGNNILTRVYDLIEKRCGDFTDRGIVPEEIDTWTNHSVKHIVIYSNWWIVKIYKTLKYFGHAIIKSICSLFGIKEKPIISWYCDSLKISDTLTTIFLATEDEWKALVDDLNKMKVDGYITYGFAKSRKVQLTCYVESYHGYSTRFIDGANGGYRKAYDMLNGV